MLSAAGFDGHIGIYSIMGGSNQVQSQRHADQVRLNLLRLEQTDGFAAFNCAPGYRKHHLLCLLQISDSFGNMDPFGTGQTLPPLQLPQTAAPPATVTPLKKPPKWIRRPVGASFAVSPVFFSLSDMKD